jgi:1-acyl-sn-glycerol-3-phosphate acyltransferase
VLKQLDHLYRQAATGFAFACFFLGASFLAAVVFPVLSWFPHYGRQRAQHVVRSIFQLYLAMLRGLGLIRLEVEGRQKLDHCRGRLIIANHPSLLDAVMLMALTPNAQCIIKHELWNNRFLGGVMRRVEYIRNDLEGGEFIEACRRSLDEGRNIIVFPEGTRSRPGIMPRFHRGFANIATMTQVEILPVVITCAPPTLTKGEPWWAVPATRPVFRLTVGDCLEADGYMTDHYRTIDTRRLVARMEAYYAERLANV